MVKFAFYPRPAELIRFSRVIGKAGKGSRFSVHGMQSVSRSTYPEISIAVLKNGPYFIINQTYADFFGSFR